MKVVVTRAPRIKKCSFGSVPEGDYFLADEINSRDACRIYEKHSPARCVGETFKLPYGIDLGKNEVIPLGSFDDMCKWVAGGRKLEDLQGDLEISRFSDLELGELFPIWNGCGAIGMKMSDSNFIEVGTDGGATVHACNPLSRIHRIGGGGTITITAP